MPVSELLVSWAETLAWDYGLRGYDAIQLASAVTWQQSIGEDVVLATFDRQLWQAAPGTGLLGVARRLWEIVLSFSSSAHPRKQSNQAVKPSTRNTTTGPVINHAAVLE
ncbi:MAG: type II toxin-antitoxin system VapC family toxin [Terriglobales bacterium]